MSKPLPGRIAESSLWPAVLAVLLGLSCKRVEQPAPPDAPPLVKTESGMEMVLIAGGRFRMGSKSGQADQAPVHEVWIDAFLIDRCEITQEQYTRLVPANPSHFKAPTRPVEMISWADAALYCNKRSRAEGLEPCYDEETAECNFRAGGYRLPTEAEWEYACRAGTDTDYSFGRDPRLLGQHAWYAENASEKTHPVGRKKPNAWGLFDMHGNVAEWCNDMYGEDYYKNSPAVNPPGPSASEVEDENKYVLRGGAWNSRADACRSAHRVGEDAGFQDACFARDAIGFRCVRRAPNSSDKKSLDKKNLDKPNPGNEGPGDSDPVVENAAEGSPDDENAADDNLPATGLVYAEVYLHHLTGSGHPERPQRLVAIIERLKAKGLFAELELIAPRPAARQWLTTVHRPQYVERIAKRCGEGAATLDSPDTHLSEQSYRVAVEAVGGVLAAVDAVIEGKVDNAFCAVRPPGHHALAERAMGFCLLNNVAIAARYAQGKHKLSRILIVDWDVHHGNGTQAMFYDDPSVLYFGIHQFPFYPGSGSEEEKGSGKGLNYTINVPLPAGSGDREYKRAFEEILKPAALAFRPDLVLVSAGFDAHENDLLGGMKVTEQGFAELTRIVKQIADRCSKGRLVSVLEGGYELEGLAASVEAHLRVLME